MGRKSSNKGSSYERLMAVRLSLWISARTNPHLLWRTPNSGARATNSKRRKELAHMAGDLEATHEDGELLLSWAYIELKHLKDLQFRQLVFGEADGVFTRIWQKASAEAAEVEKEPMVILKETRHGEVMMVTPRVSKVFRAAGADRTCVFTRLRAHAFPLREVLRLPFIRVKAMIEASR